MLIEMLAVKFTSNRLLQRNSYKEMNWLKIKFHYNEEISRNSIQHNGEVTREGVNVI